ncbi:MAG: hypothetical protein ABJG42_24300 [Vibrio splendidus]
MKKTLIALSLIATTLSGCATYPSKMIPTPHSDKELAELSCEVLTNKYESLYANDQKMYAELDQLATNDTTQAVVGTVLFWPALLFLEFGDHGLAEQYKDNRGELDSVLRVIDVKDCPIPKEMKAELVRPVEEMTEIKDADSADVTCYQNGCFDANGSVVR